MDIKEDAKILLHPIELRRLFSIRKSIFEVVAPLSVTYSPTGEPTPYEQREKGQRPIKKGEKWGGVFDCAWFRFRGDAPEARGKKLAAIIDVYGEGLYFDGDAVSGISHPFNIFNVAELFNLTAGKSVVFPEIIDGKVDFWVDCGFNGAFGRPMGNGKLRRSELAYYDDERAALYFDYLAAAFAHAAFKGRRRRELSAALNKAYSLFSKGDVKRARGVLAELLSRPSASALTVTAIGHSHLDLGWLWPIRETRRKAARTVTNALKNLDKYPDYIYGASQPQQFAWIKEDFPKLYERVKTAVKSGRFELQGGMWCECDTNITGGESLIRQFLYGRKFWREEFGEEVGNCWLPDVFGYSACLPQIIKKCGAQYFMTQKLSWNEHNDFPYETFLWEGLSDDCVTVHLPPANTYNSSGAAPSLAELERNHRKKDKTDSALMLYGAGDGGGGPCEANIELIKRYRSLAGLPILKFGRVDAFFAETDKNKGILPRYKGELYLEKHQGTYTTQSDTKKNNRFCENAFHEVEALAAYAGSRGYEYPRKKIEELWKETLLYQFHDILPGSSIGRIYEECSAGYRNILRCLSEEKTRLFAFLNGGEGLSAFNPAPFARDELLERDGKIYRFTAAPYATEPLLPASAAGAVAVGERFIENERLRIEFDSDGSVKSAVDRTDGTEYNGGYLNRLTVYRDKKLFYNAWDIDINYTEKPFSLFRCLSFGTFTEGTSAVAVSELVFGKSRITQRISLSAGKPYAEIVLDVLWREKHKMLRADFKPAFYSDEVTCDIQFGNIKRSTRTDTSLRRAQFEIPAHKYIDVSDGAHGSAILSEAKYGFRVKDGIISLNLLRSPVYPDRGADRGSHRIRYAYYPHAKDCFDAETPKYAYLFNYAPSVFEGKIQFAGLASTDKRNVIVETVKPAEDGRGIVLRLYENEGRETDTLLETALPFSELYLTDMTENIEGETGRELHFRPYEIKTLLLK